MIQFTRRFCVAIFVLASVLLFEPRIGHTQVATQSDQVLKIMTIERQPFTIIQQGKYSGFSIDLWRALASKMGLRYEFVTASSFATMLEAVTNGQASAAVANISITSGREEIMDFTQPIFDSGLQILMRERSGSISIVSALLTWQMFSWLAVAGLVLFASATLMWFFERRKQPFFGQSYREGIWQSFWWALNVVVNGGFEERIPKSWPGRIFAVLLVVASLFVVSIFVAKITATLTVGELRSNVQSLSDLYGKKVGTTAGSTTASFLKSRSVRFVEFGNIDALFTALETGGIDAVVHDAPILAYYAATKGKGVVRTAGKIFRPEKYGIALPQGSPLVELINRNLLKMREDGTYLALVQKWFGDKYQ